MNSLGFICATKGRPLITNLIASFNDQAQPEDHLRIIGDGWHEEWIDEFVTERVVFVERDFTGFFGHPHYTWALENDLIGTDFVGLIGDDDMFLPGGLESIRKAIKPNLTKNVFWFPLIAEEDNSVGIRDFPEPYFRLAMSTDRSEWAPFGTNGFSDGMFFTDELLRFGDDAVQKTDSSVEVNKIYNLTEDKWTKLGLCTAFDPTNKSKYCSTWVELEESNG